MVALHRVFWSGFVGVMGVGCTSDLGALPVVSRATVRLAVDDLTAPPEVDVALTLVGGDADHTAVLDVIAIGHQFGESEPIALRFATPTVEMEARTNITVPLVGTILREQLIDHCQSTLPVFAQLRFEDEAGLLPASPPGQLAVFCD